MHTISFDRLTKRYGPVPAVDGLSFDVGPGRSPVPPGPTGALLYIAEPLLGFIPLPRRHDPAPRPWRRGRRRHRTAQQARHHLTTHPHHPNTTSPGDASRPGVWKER